MNYYLRYPSQVTIYFFKSVIALLHYCYIVTLHNMTLHMTGRHSRHKSTVMTTLKSLPSLFKLNRYTTEPYSSLHTIQSGVHFAKAPHHIMYVLFGLFAMTDIFIL